MDKYAGSELLLFAGARHWKAYWASRVKPYTRGKVLEVGAGIGTNLKVLANPAVTSWHALEPDGSLAAEIDRNQAFPVDVTIGTTRDLPGDRFDTILYIDVLEHIEDDSEELQRAWELLEPGGYLIVLAPAHNSLYSNFDAAIGHYRRYNRDTLEAVAPGGAALLQAEYLDSVGMLASMANRLLLRQAEPGARQISVWDNFMVPASRIMDVLTMHRLGKTVVCIWQKIQ